MKKLHLLLLLLLAHSAAYSQAYWEKVTSGTSKDLLRISFGSSSIGYIGGMDSTLLKTTDGGKTWNALLHTGIEYEPYTRDIIDLKFVSADIGYAVLSNRDRPDLNGQIYKTIDGGYSWFKPAKVYTSVYRAFFFDEYNGYLIGVSPFAGPTINKLDASVLGPVEYLGTGTSYLATAIDFFNTSTGMVGGDYGYIYRTFDAGFTWDTVKTNIDTVIHSLLYLDENTIVASSGFPGAAIIISKDKGATWNFDPHSATFYYPDIKAMARSKRDSIIMVGNSITTGKGIIYYFNPTTPWTSMDISDAEQWLNHVTVRNDSVAYIVGDSGLILSNDKSDLSVTEPSVFQQQLQVYPNPSQGHFYASLADLHQILIYDLNGKIVYRDDTRSMTHSVDLSDLPRGNYILDAILNNANRVSASLQLR